MSLDNFIPTIWSGNFLSAFQKASVYTGPGVVNRNWEGEIRDKGDRVKLIQIGDPTVSDYVKNSTSLTFETLEDASLFLEINQSKSFSFAIDDVDKAQANGDVMALAMERAAYKMKDTVDQYLASLYTSAGVTSGLGTTATPLTVTAKATAGSNISITELFATISQKLDEANCPSDGRFIVLPPVLKMKLNLGSIAVTGVSQQQQAMTGGFVTNAFGFNIYVSNNVPNTSSAKYRVLAGVPAAITYAEQINSTEALRLQNSFSDGVKGLMLYGAKVVQPNGLACACVSSAAEA